MGARTAVLELLQENPGWRCFFRQCCETSSFRLCSQVWQRRADLRDRGQDFDLQVLEDALSDLARELMPDSPAAAWDATWEREMPERAERYAEEKMDKLPPESRATVDVRSDLLVEVGRAAAERSRARYQMALRAWCRGVRDAAAEAGKGAV
jgi:hypothetical protein